MGKGTIKSNLGDGQYTIEVDLDQTAKARLIAALELKIEAANQVVENLKVDIEDLVDVTPDADPVVDPEVLEPDPEPDPEYDTENPPETGTATISGNTNEETSMANLVGITVTAYRYWSGSGASGYINAGSADTNASGEFTLVGLAPGEYTLKFTDSATGAYKTEYYSDKDNLTESTKFTVADGAAVTGKNAVLAAAASIAGVVTG